MGKRGRDAAEAYRDDGFLFPIRVMSEHEAGKCRKELEQIERDWLDAGLPLPLLHYKRVHAQCVMPLAARLVIPDLASPRGVIDEQH